MRDVGPGESRVRGVQPRSPSFKQRMEDRIAVVNLQPIAIRKVQFSYLNRDYGARGAACIDHPSAINLRACRVARRVARAVGED